MISEPRKALLLPSRLMLCAVAVVLLGFRLSLAVCTPIWTESFDPQSQSWSYAAPWELAPHGIFNRGGNSLGFTDQDFDQTVIAAIVDLTVPPEGADLLLWHHFDNHEEWDGGKADISTDSGATWIRTCNTDSILYPDESCDANIVELSGGYTTALSGSALSPFQYQEIWTGNNGGMAESNVHLSQWAGQTIKVRLGFAFDVRHPDPEDPDAIRASWYIDDIRLVPLSCTPPPPNCGDGAIQVGEGEACDEGPANGASGSCCTSSCQVRAAGATCRPSISLCDAAETCSGVSGACPANQVSAAGTVCRAAAGSCDVAEVCDGATPGCAPDGFQPSTTQCRAAAGECDLAENCPGNAGSCPADAKQPGGTTCTSDGNACTVDQCDGSSVSCQHPAGNAGVLCRPSAGACDVGELCTGTSPACPADGWAASSTVCRAAAGECDLPESCSGSGAACPLDAKKAIGMACTSDGNPCTADQCDGTAVACQHPPGNAGAECRPVAGPCDRHELCDGTSPTCPANQFEPSTMACRPLAGECDLAENCPGIGPACPADGRKPAATACTNDGNLCTADTCDGVNVTCQHPPGNAGTVCRPVAGVCDVAEACTGASATCPSDGFGAATVQCRPSTGACDPAENCPGTGVNCPGDVRHPSGTLCRAAAGACDLDERCDGTSPSCPADAVAPSTAGCRSSGGVCDVAEQCSGTGPTCPPDGKSAALCRAAADACDPPESCDGVSDSCPADVFDSDGDGLGDLCDNCRTARNPDQLDSDFSCQNLAEQGVCGDVCDACPLYADNGQCDHALSGGMSVDPTQAATLVLERPGADFRRVEVFVPAGAVSAPTSLSATDNLSFYDVSGVGGAGRVVFAVGFGPPPRCTCTAAAECGTGGTCSAGVCTQGDVGRIHCATTSDCASGQMCVGPTFAQAVTVTFTWPDSDNDDDVDGFVPALLESRLRIFRNGTRIAGPCSNALYQASCSGPGCTCPGTADASVGLVSACCNMVANTWTLQVTKFSEYIVGDGVAVLIPGTGSTRTDCVMEWDVVDPEENPPGDRRGLRNPRRTCRDGDLLCDADGTVNGSCTFAVRVCVNVDDARLRDRAGMPACTPSDVRGVFLRQPRLTDPKQERAAAATLLRGLLASLGASSLSDRQVSYSPPITERDLCSEAGNVVVPLNGTAENALRVAATAEMSAGAKDSDKLQLRCLAE